MSARSTSQVAILRRTIVVGVAGALVAALGVCLPWHTVQDGGLGAAFTCIGMVEGCPPSSGPPAARMELGLDHDGMVMVAVLLLSIAAMLGVARWRTTRWTALLAGSWALLCGVLVGVMTFIDTALHHIFDKTHTLLGEVMFGIGWIMLLVAGGACAARNRQAIQCPAELPLARRVSRNRQGRRPRTWT